MVNLALEDQIVEILILLGFFEGEDALHDDEQDDTSGKHVDSSAVILLSFLDLWSHVGHRASVRVKLVDLLVGCEAEVCDFQAKVVID